MKLTAKNLKDLIIEVIEERDEEIEEVEEPAEDVEEGGFKYEPNPEAAQATLVKALQEGWER